MKVILSGASGLIGSALSSRLRADGDEIGRLVRSADRRGEDGILWDPLSGEIEAEKLENADAVIHLAGRNVAAARWTEREKADIRDSRVMGTRLLSETLANLDKPPKVFVSASAIGFYGDRGDEILTEASEPGSDFLAAVCQEWEAAVEPARARGIRVVAPRIGVVLAGAGGALVKMLTPFRFGLGGRIGHGRQYWSWIAVDDVVAALLHCVCTEALVGPVNCIAPNPVSNSDFTQTLATVLSRPALFPLPAFLARVMLGEMADALLLASTRVEPQRLLATGYRFLQPDLEGALRHILDKVDRSPPQPA